MELNLTSAIRYIWYSKFALNYLGIMNLPASRQDGRSNIEIADSINDYIDRPTNNASVKTEKLDWFTKLFISHYGDLQTRRSEKAIHNDLEFCCGLKFAPWTLFPASIATLFCCGSLYAWSVFNKPIDTHIYNNPNEDMAPITFYIAILFLGLAAAVSGPLVERYGPHSTIFASACLVFIGAIISASAIQVKQIWLLYIGYGVVSGAGYGMAYITPISVLQKWFPQHRGITAGLALAGFAFGSVIISKVALPLINAIGLQWTFMAMGLLYTFILGVSGWIIRQPPLQAAPSPTMIELSAIEAHNSTSSAAIDTTYTTSGSCPADHVQLNKNLTDNTIMLSFLASRNFILLYIAFFCGCLFGLVSSSRLSNMVVELFHEKQKAAATIVAINGVFNAMGRIGFAIISDLVGPKRCYAIIMCLQLTFMIVLLIVTDLDAQWPFVVTAWLATACFGGIMSVLPGLITRMFGAQYTGVCHGVLMTAFSLAGVGGGLLFSAIYQLITKKYDITPEHPIVYLVNFYWITAASLAGLVFLFFVQIPKSCDTNA
ncbi:major facilitator superfamily domain-containing protein [Syncephalis fuscata]|nr:major facilitator superfamily domain-containing protein [Syncephalis fuscata]